MQRQLSVDARTSALISGSLDGVRNNKVDVTVVFHPRSSRLVSHYYPPRFVIRFPIAADTVGLVVHTNVGPARTPPPGPARLLRHMLLVIEQREEAHMYMF